jgi:hypothetical protein
MPRPLGSKNQTSQVIEALKTELTTLQSKEASTPQTDMEELALLADTLRVIMRAMKGLGADDDVFLGLIKVKDIRERTRLDETTTISHSAMRVAAKRWPEFKLFEEITEMKDPYYISIDGEGRKEGILLQQAKTKMDGNMILNMPNTQGGVAQTDQPQGQAPSQKKSFINRVLHR